MIDVSSASSGPPADPQPTTGDSGLVVGPRHSVAQWDKLQHRPILAQTTCHLNHVAGKL